MRLSRGFVVSSLLALLCAVASLHVLAQGVSTATSSDCPECDSLLRQVDDDDAAIKRLKAEVDRLKASLQEAQAAAAMGKGLAPDVKNSNAAIAQAQAKVDARQRVLSDDLAKLEGCHRPCDERSAMRRPLPPFPTAIPIGHHAKPVAACVDVACEEAARTASAALVTLSSLELSYSMKRHVAFIEFSWLSGHAKTSAQYFGHLSAYLRDLEAMRSNARSIENDGADFNEAMNALAKCNAQCKESESYMVTPPATGPADEEPRAACPECEEAALQVKVDLAWVAYYKAVLGRDALERAAIIHERPLTLKENADLDKAMKVSSELIAKSEKRLAADRATLDACNKLHPSTTCQPPAEQNMLPGGAPGPQTQGSGTLPKASSGPTTPPPAGGGAPGPGAPGGTGEPRAPPVPPPSLPGITTEPAPAPPLETKPMSTGGVVTPQFTFSAGPGLVIDKPISLAVYPMTDSAVLRGPTRIDTIALNVGVSNFAPSWLPNYGFNFGGMDGNRSTSTQVPVGIQSGWVYQIAAPNGSTGISSNGGLNVNLKTTFYDFNFGFTLPPQAIKDEDSSKIWFDRLAWIRYAKTRYGGMVSIALNPDISSTTEQNIHEYDLGAGIGLRGEHTFPNRFVGSVGIGADLILYHANYSGSQDNTCPVCSPAEQNFNASTSDSANRFAVGASATAGLSYPVSNNAALFFKVTYRAEFAAPILVNKISPSNLAPHLSTGTRQFGSGLFGFSVNF